MSTFRNKRREDELLKVAEQAAEWLIVLGEEPKPAERASFAEWLEESPLHVEMFLRAAAVDRLGDMMSAAARERIAAAATVATEATANVIPLVDKERRPIPAPAARKRRLPWIVGIAASITALAAGLWWYGRDGLSSQHYVTAVGEQRSITLNDGSVVSLNSDSQVTVNYHRDARDIRLLNGEAIFKVAHDSTRPFRVHVDEAVVQAIGTQFDIYRKARRTTVAVIEGVVQISSNLVKDSPKPSVFQPAATAISQVSSSSAVPQPRRLEAGQAVTLATNGEIENPVTIDIAQVTAWRQRRLVFEWETLEAIATEFNRYNRMQIRVEGEAASQRRYTAVFDANEPQTLINFLSRDSALEFTTQGSELIIRQKERSDLLSVQQLSK